MKAWGQGLVQGIAIGEIRFFRQYRYEIHDQGTLQPGVEADAFLEAVQAVISRQEELHETAVKSAGEQEAEIFGARIGILEDTELRESILEMILKERKEAVYAVKVHFDRRAGFLKGSGDEYLAERGEDILDLENMLLEELMKRRSGRDSICEISEIRKKPYILAARDMTPSDLISIEKSEILGVILREGSPVSHTAILLRSMGIPTVFRCSGLDAGWDRRTAVVDGTEGCVYVDPHRELMEEMQRKLQKERKKTEHLRNGIRRICRTADGIRVEVLANIDSAEEVSCAEENGAEGIGLLRTEFMYMNRSDYPGEEEQYKAYRKAAEMISPGKMVIRTCDLGADKTPAYMALKKENNPALGYRAIRISLTRREMFKAQLRAVLRASVCGNVSLLLPMITELKEVRETKEIMEECRNELTEEGIRTGDCPLGIMVETPAAALCAEELAAEVDFISVGTNDLLQYTCAVDRENVGLERFSNFRHPAVLKLVQMTVEAAHKAGIPAGICGELGADVTMTEKLLKMGIRRFSVGTSAILPLKEKIGKCSISVSAK